MNVAAFCVLALSSLGAGERGYVLEFSSETCGPCQQVAPVVSKLEREGLPIRSVDVNADRDLAEQYNVTSIPTFILIVDDKEVERMSSVQSEGRIRQMLARIPTTGRGTSNDRLAVNLGESTPLPRPEVIVPTEPRQSSSVREGAVAERDESPKRFWPFKQPGKQTTPTDVRGNNPDSMPATDSNLSIAPMDASVRIRVLTGNSVVRGSGTVIESLAGRSTILTCSHICRGATEGTKVEVDLFRDGQPMTILGTIVGTDPDADVALISIPTDEVVPSTPVGALPQSPAIGTKVVSIGCGGGAEPSREQLVITDVNKFSGPDTLICSGIPVQGRSGGGLFNLEGTLVGVCFAADADEKTKKPSGGVYCGLKPIHALLSKHAMSHLMPSIAEESSLATSEAESSAAEWPGETRPGQAAPLTAAATATAVEESDAKPFVVQPAKAASVEEFTADDAEVVVLIRSRTAGSDGDKVILIHKPSRKFLQFVQGEVSGDTEESAPVTRRSASPSAESVTERVVKVKPSTRSLLPTGLESKREPRPYVRSKQK